MTGSKAGVLLMTYGSPATLDEPGIRAYLLKVRGGREPDDDLVTEFTRRYQVIGGSPLIEITRQQAAALEARLDLPVRVGMRFSDPSMAAGLEALASEGVSRVVAIVLSPQFSPLLMGGYEKAIAEARATIGDAAPDVVLAPAWHLDPDFVAAVARRIHEALESFSADARSMVPVLLTAHSVPRRVAAREPAYLTQLEETAKAIASAAGLADDRWRFCWQSAGHEPGEWMKPDFADLMPELAAAGHSTVLVAPVQFLSDHLEVLYDVDVGAREQAEQTGLRFSRIQSLNVEPGFIDALATVARSTLG